MAVNWGEKFKPSTRLVLISLVIELWALTAYSITIIGLALFLYSHRRVDSTMAAGVLFSLMGSIITMAYVAAHCLLSRKLCLAGLRRPRKTRLDSACSNLPRLLMLLWIVAAAMDLIVAVRRPICLTSSKSAGFWASGLSCRMHRAIGALSVLALISSCSVFCVNELSDKSFYASLTGYHKAVLHDSITIPSDPPKSSSSVSSGASSSSFSKSQSLYNVYDLESNITCHNSWLQRRDSISSQRAMYPPVLLTRNPFNYPSRSFSSTPVLDAFDTVPPTKFRTRSNSNPSITTTALLTPSTYSQPSRTPSIVSSITPPRQLPLSNTNIQRTGQPEISIDLLSRTLDPSSPPWEKPTIRHIPLSDDPAIRKLSEGDPNESNSNSSSSDEDDSHRLIGSNGNPLSRKRRSVRRNIFADVVATRSTATSSAAILPSPFPTRTAGSYSMIPRVPVPRTPSLTSNGSLQTEMSLNNIRRPPAVARWSQQRGRRQWTHHNRSYASMSSWYTDTIHE